MTVSKEQYDQVLWLAATSIVCTNKALTDQSWEALEEQGLDPFLVHQDLINEQIDELDRTAKMLTE